MKLNKILIIILIAVLLSVSVFALDCQYTETKKYAEDTEAFYHNGVLIGENLNLSDSVSVKVDKYTIVATNNLDVPIDLEILYKRYSYGFGVNEEKTITLHIAKNDFERYEDSFEKSSGCGSVMGCSVSLIKYKFAEPNIITSEFLSVPKEKIVCSECYGYDCLNDGAVCSKSQECGGGYCVRGVCSNSESCFDNDCKCAPEEIQCKDGACVKKNIIPLDNAPKCDMAEECISNYVDIKSGLCAKSPSVIDKEKKEKKVFVGFIIFIGLVVLLIVMGLLLLKFPGDLEKETKKLTKEIEDLKNLKNSLVSTVDNLKTEAKDIDNSISKKNEKIKRLKQKIKNAKGEAKGALEKQLKDEKKEQKHRMDDLKLRTDELNREKEKLQLLEKELNDKSEELEGKKTEIEKNSNKTRIKEFEEKYKKEYEHASSEVFYDKETKYFKIKYRNGREYDLHWKVYKDRVSQNLHGTNIHHIDYDELNNEIWNLIALPSAAHKEFNHYKINNKGNWESGIEQLKKQLGMAEADLPDHIKNELKKRKEQTELKDYPKKKRRKHESKKHRKR
jgi:hypothetical protein